ncbi:MAG: hypothetical protein LWW75_05000 [Chlorobiales bacterium]|nr:hypothetical protein [Chlorobiales bacterium]
MNKTAQLIVMAKAAAERGVDYSARDGAKCPFCGTKTKIYRSMPWEESFRVRYHRCEQGSCPLSALRVTIKSVQCDALSAPQRG